MRLQTTTLARDQRREQQQQQQDRQRLAFDQIVSPVTSEYDAINADGLSGEWLSLKVGAFSRSCTPRSGRTALRTAFFVRPVFPEEEHSIARL
jgi:hypothetical protein